MVKKSLIAIAVVALLVATAQAGDSPNGSFKEDGMWPYVYIEVDLCTLPVYMDVGYYVTIKDCNKLSVLLKQVDCESIDQAGKFPCYQGCVRHSDDGVGFDARANFDAIFGVRLDKVGEPAVLNETKTYFVGDNTIPGDGEWHKMEICIDAWKTNVYNDGPGDKVKVGEVTITVKPDSGY